ncbi:MAG: hypothetical protein IRZ02_03030 [Acidothermus sp.]|nr:hypothetical protein [Acidothermus sp.]MCL6537103.1 hypothetical protein [Acidothermus sp.]
MPWWFWAIVAAIVVLTYLVATIGRLERLHARVEAARAILDSHLLRRSAVVLELAASGLLDPATSLLLATAAHRARTAAGTDREAEESALSVALRAAFDDEDGDLVALLIADPSARSLVEELEAVTTKIPLARRFHNDAVRATLAVRRHRLVRWLRLAHRFAEPTSFEMDDDPPAALARLALIRSGPHEDWPTSRPA